MGIEAEDVMLAPVVANPFRAEVEVLSASGYVPGEHRWLPRPRVTLHLDGEVPLLRHPPGLGRDEVEAILGRARADADVEHYLVWARFPYVEVVRDPDAWVVRWSDARYDGQPGAGGLSGVTVRVGR